MDYGLANFWSDVVAAKSAVGLWIERRSAAISAIAAVAQAVGAILAIRSSIKLAREGAERAADVEAAALAREIAAEQRRRKEDQERQDRIDRDEKQKQNRAIVAVSDQIDLALADLHQLVITYRAKVTDHDTTPYYFSYIGLPINDAKLLISKIIDEPIDPGLAVSFIRLDKVLAQSIMPSTSIAYTADQILSDLELKYDRISVARNETLTFMHDMR
jgi:hypothetical protein